MSMELSVCVWTPESGVARAVPWVGADTGCPACMQKSVTVAVMTPPARSVIPFIGGIGDTLCIGLHRGLVEALRAHPLPDGLGIGCVLAVFCEACSAVYGYAVGGAEDGRPWSGWLGHDDEPFQLMSMPTGEADA